MKGLNTYKGLTFIAIIIIYALLYSCNFNPKAEMYFPESSLTGMSEQTVRSFLPAQNMDQSAEIFVQMGHTDDGYTSNTIADFTPDGRYVLTGGEDGNIKLWETLSGREVKTFKCQDAVTDIAVSKDGKYLASGDRFYGDNIHIREIATGALKQSFAMEVLNGPPLQFCFNGDRLVAGGKDGLIQLRDISSGTVIREFKEEIFGEVSTLILTPDERKIIAGYRYHNEEQRGTVNTIFVWDMSSGEKLLSFNNVSDQTIALAVTPDGRQLLSSDWGQDSVRVWDLNTGQLMKSYATGGTSAIAISAGGRYALFGGYSNFSLVELTTGKEIRKISSDIRDWIKSIKFSPDGRFALTGDQVPKPKLWDIDSGQLLKTFGGYAGEIINVTSAAEKTILMTAQGASNTLNFWDFKNGMFLNRIKNDKNCLLTSASFSPDGLKAAFSGWDMAAQNAYVSIWDVSIATKIIQIHPPEQTSVHGRTPVFTKDGRKVLWAAGANVYIHDTATGNRINQYIPGYADIKRITLDPSENYMLAEDDIRDATLINLTTGETLNTYKHTRCAFSNDGQKIYALQATSEGTAILKELNIFTLQEKFLFQFEFSSAIPLGNMNMYNEPERLTAGANENYLFFSDSYKNNIYKIDLKRKAITAVYEGHTDKITSICNIPGGTFICSASHDGTTRLWNTESGQEAARFVSFSNEEWIVITPEGHFNASAQGAAYLNVRVGSQVYSIDNFYEKYYDPAYVASVLQGLHVQPASDIRNVVQLPPEIKITAPETGSEYEQEDIEVRISAKDMGGGINEIRLYHNGKAVGGDTRGMKIVRENDPDTRSFLVRLVDGVNTFRAVGFSNNHTESFPSEVTVTFQSKNKEISLHVLAAGINRYENPALSLNYAEPDAWGIEDFFRQRATELFKSVQVNDIYNEQVTKNELVSKLAALKNTNPQDAVLIYLAGHGENINEKWYFIPYELTYPERQDEVMTKGISSDELSVLIKEIRAQKVLMLIDACKSGAMLLAFRGFEDRKALAQLSRATGVHVVAASSKDQFASEVKELGHGVFTYTLLAGLNGQAADKGEIITVRKLLAYIEEELPEITKKYRQEAQYPVVDSKGMDFPIARGSN